MTSFPEITLANPAENAHLSARTLSDIILLYHRTYIFSISYHINFSCRFENYFGDYAHIIIITVQERNDHYYEQFKILQNRPCR